MDEVAKAIWRGGQEQGWQISEVPWRAGRNA
jgi:hypothetical protein